MSTRSATSHWLFGDPLFKLDELYLPSELEILQRYFYIKTFFLQIKDSDKLSDDEKDRIRSIILDEIICIWTNSNLPFKDKYTVDRQLKYLIEKAEVFAHNNHKHRWTNLQDEKWVLDRQNEYKID